jgi:hypothetical protein
MHLTWVILCASRPAAGSGGRTCHPSVGGRPLEVHAGLPQAAIGLILRHLQLHFSHADSISEKGEPTSVVCLSGNSMTAMCGTENASR